MLLRISFVFLLIQFAGCMQPVLAAPKGALVLYNEEGEPMVIEHEKALAYIDKFRHIAIFEKDRAGIPASIKMAQGILESGSGQSELARNGHNHFGIKCGSSWSGKTFFMWDDDVVKSCFRVFPRDEDSYIAHTNFLLDPKKKWRYGFLFKLDIHDYKAWAKGLQKAGYATAKTYSRNLISIIERYELYKLDYLTFETFAVAAGEMDSIFNLPKIEPPVLDTVEEEPIAIVIPDPFGQKKDSVSMVLTRSMFKQHGIMTVYVQPGDALEDIVYRYDVSMKKIVKYNEIPETYRIRTGQFMYLEKKNRKYTGKEKFHIVRSGQTMYDIAQHYGIRLKNLIKLNKVYKNTSPKVGTKIRLQK